MFQSGKKIMLLNSFNLKRVALHFHKCPHPIKIPISCFVSFSENMIAISTFTNSYFIMKDPVNRGGSLLKHIVHNILFCIYIQDNFGFKDPVSLESRIIDSSGNWDYRFLFPENLQQALPPPPSQCLPYLQYKVMQGVS